MMSVNLRIIQGAEPDLRERPFSRIDRIMGVSARCQSCKAKDGAVGMSRWFVELVLPSGTFACRPVVSSRSDSELDLDAHAAMAELLDWKRATPCCAGAPCFPIYAVPELPLRSGRFLLAHCEDAAGARMMADRLRTSLPHPLPPWSEKMRAVLRNCAPEPRS